MRAGAEVIYQATFAHDGWRGRADFLIRVDEPSDLGAWSYEVWDTKLARSAKPAAVLQLASTRRRSRAIQGRHAGAAARRPRHERSSRPTGPGDFDAFLRTAQRRLRAHLAAPPDIYPWPCEHCSRCDFIPVCRERWEDGRPPDARRLDPARPVEKLNGVGVETLAGLAESPPTLACAPRRAADARRAARPGRPPAPPPPHRRAHPPPARAGERARPRPPAAALARRPLLRHGGRPVLRGRRRARVPVRRARRASPTAGPTTRAFWARDRAGERKAFEEFIDLVHARLAEHPDMHVYHYAAYEPATLSRLMGAHATREAEVDDLLRREILVDLFRVVRQGLRAGVRSYSLKEIEQFFFTRTADVKSGNDAVLELRALPRERRRDAPRRHRGLQRGGLPRDARAARLAARAARRGRGRVRGRDPLPACRPSARGEEGIGRGALGDRPASGTPCSRRRTAATSAGSRRSSSTTTAARRARAGGGTSAGSR